MRTLTIVLVLVTGWLFLSGCETARPGVKNVMGTLEGAVAAGPAAATDAAKQAMEDLKLASIEASSTELDGQATARTALGDKVTVRIHKLGDNVSEVKIRVGDLGNEAVSMQIYEKMQSRLGD